MPNVGTSIVRRWYAETLTSMRPCAAPIGNSECIFGEHEVQRVALVAEGCSHHRDARSVPVATASFETRKVDVIGEVLGDELVDDF